MRAPPSPSSRPRHRRAFQNTFATIPGIVAPLITASLADVEARDISSHWQNVFFLSAAISVSGVTAYVLFARADVDPRLAFAAGSYAGVDGDADEESSVELLK